MKPSFYLIDDDPSIRRILSNIIDEYRLGYVMGESSDGNVAIDEILELKPDIVLVDLLLPSIDGVEIVKKVKEKDEHIQFIMISQVTSKDIIGEAYESGIEFFINKPINVVEVVTIVRRAIENFNLRKALSLIEKTLERNKYNVFTKNEENDEPDKNKFKEHVIRIFSDLGILGEAGSNDLLDIIEIIIQERKELGVKIHEYKISDIYRKLHHKYNSEGKPAITIKAIEQRVRRIIQSALVNIANIGIEDYGNSKFEKYSTSLFDFREVRREMDYIRKKSRYRGKINVKKFIEGIISHVEI